MRSTIGKHETSFSWNHGIFVCQYHQTKIFTYKPDYKTIAFNNGGWLTSTTKKRMNQCLKHLDLPGSVYQKNGQWFYNDMPFQGNQLEITLT